MIKKRNTNDLRKPVFRTDACYISFWHVLIMKSILLSGFWSLLFFFNYVPCCFPCRDPESAGVAILELKRQNESLVEQSQELMEANQTLRMANAVNIATIQDLEHENSVFAASYEESAATYGKLKTAYGQSKEENRQLVLDKKKHELKHRRVMAEMQRATVRNDNMRRLCEESVGLVIKNYSANCFHCIYNLLLFL